MGLEERLRTEIQARGPLTFARFMELALYDTEEGYYMRAGDRRLGPAGDYVTSSDVGGVWGPCLARQLVEVDEALGRPSPLRVVEFGAGRGLLARELLDAVRTEAPELAARLELVLVDRSPAMRERAAREVPEAAVVAPEAVARGGAGMVLAFELFDALPVHRLRRRDGKLLEVYVGCDAAGRLVEREGPPTAQAARLAQRYGAAREEGTEAEVCPEAEEVLASMAAVLERGVWLVVDYGDDAKGLYGTARARGTLLAYRRHTAHERWFEQVGEQDLTAHVNFTQLEDALREHGCEVFGRTTQDRFLIALGALAPFAETDPQRWRQPGAVHARLRAKQLVHPLGMGRCFQVLVAGRGMPRVAWAGLRDPFSDAR